MFEYIVAKVEERKILKHPLFEQVASKYW